LHACCVSAEMPGLEHSFAFHLNTPAYVLMSDGVASEQVKKFFFTSGKISTGSGVEDEIDDTLEVYIPEVSTTNVSYIVYRIARITYK
jgi:hypothetical protein